VKDQGDEMFSWCKVKYSKVRKLSGGVAVNWFYLFYLFI